MKLSEFIKKLKSYKEPNTDPEISFAYVSCGELVTTDDDFTIVKFPSSIHGDEEQVKIYFGMHRWGEQIRGKM